MHLGGGEVVSQCCDPLVQALLFGSGISLQGVQACTISFRYCVKL